MWRKLAIVIVALVVGIIGAGGWFLHAGGVIPFVPVLWQDYAGGAVDATIGYASRWSWLAWLQGPKVHYPDVPQLELELGQHVADIDSMARDRDGRYAVTASDDKTVRVWELPNAVHSDVQMVDVLRPPAGEGSLGGVIGVAISPDASLVATGGTTGTEGNYSVHLFDRLTGHIVRSLKVPAVILTLAFSPEGKYLAAGLASDRGLVVWRTSDWRRVARFDHIGNNPFGLAFAADDRLVFASRDDHVRLYRPEGYGFTQTAEAVISSRPLLYRVAFSPDGKTLALGHSGDAAVTLLNADTLTNERQLKLPGFKPSDGTDKPHSVSGVAWSEDGQYLFAGGEDGKNGESVLWRWDLLKGGEPRFFTGSGVSNTFADILPYRNSRLLVAGADPLVGILDSEGKPLLAVGPHQHDMRPDDATAPFDRFRVSADGAAVELPAIRNGQSPIVIDLRGRRASRIVAPNAAFSAPLMQSPVFRVEGWRNTTHPVLKRAAGGPAVVLAINKDEYAESIAIAPSSKWFVLGTFGHIRVYSDHGVALGQVNLPVEAWRVNITPDGRFVIAAGADGVVRWFVVHDQQGKIALDAVLNVFVDEPALHWVAWGPHSNLYDASVGAEDMIGWRINRGENQSALFYGASRFRSLFLRPGLALEVLTARREPPARDARVLLDQLPPIVRILGIDVDRDGRATVRYIAESPGGIPIKSVRLKVDGAADDQSGARGIPKTQPSAGYSIASAQVLLPAGTDPHSIEVTASTKNGYGDVAHRMVPPVTSGAALGQLYALVIGVANVKNDPTRTADYADSDALAVEELLNGQRGVMYAGVHVKHLINEEATVDAIIDALNELARQSGSDQNSTAVLFIAGHGTTWQSGVTGAPSDSYYFVPYDYNPNRSRTGISVADLSSQFASQKGGIKLIFIDTCHSAKGGELIAMDAVVNTLGSAENGTFVWSSSQGDEEAYPVPSLRKGTMAAALEKALRGQAAGTTYPTRNHDVITQRSLTGWLDFEIPELSGYRQQPQPSLRASNGNAVRIFGISHQRLAKSGKENTEHTQ